MYQLSGENDFIMFTVGKSRLLQPAHHLSSCCPGSSLVSLTAFVLFNAFFMFVDLTGRPKWMSQYRIQEERNVPVGPFP